MVGDCKPIPIVGLFNNRNWLMVVGLFTIGIPHGWVIPSYPVFPPLIHQLMYQLSTIFYHQVVHHHRITKPCGYDFAMDRTRTTPAPRRLSHAIPTELQKQRQQVVPGDVLKLSRHGGPVGTSVHVGSVLGHMVGLMVGLGCWDCGGPVVS